MPVETIAYPQTSTITYVLQTFKGAKDGTVFDVMDLP